MQSYIKRKWSTQPEYQRSERQSHITKTRRHERHEQIVWVSFQINCYSNYLSLDDICTAVWQYETRSSAVAERPRDVIILLSHSTSFKVIWNYTDEGLCKVLPVIHCRPKCRHVNLVPLVSSASNIVVILKSGLGVVQGRWKWRRSIGHVRHTIGLPLQV